MRPVVVSWGKLRSAVDLQQPRPTRGVIGVVTRDTRGKRWRPSRLEAVLTRGGCLESWHRWRHRREMNDPSSFLGLDRQGVEGL